MRSRFVDNEAVRLLTGDNLSELLGCPVRGGVSGDVEMSDSACSHFHDHEDVQQPKAGRRGDEKSQHRIPWAWLRTKVIQR
jgi:hypothetical protein